MQRETRIDRAVEASRFLVVFKRRRPNRHWAAVARLYPTVVSVVRVVKVFPSGRPKIFAQGQLVRGRNGRHPLAPEVHTIRPLHESINIFVSNQEAPEMAPEPSGFNVFPIHSLRYGASRSNDKSATSHDRPSASVFCTRLARSGKSEPFSAHDEPSCSSPQSGSKRGAHQPPSDSASAFVLRNEWEGSRIRNTGQRQRNLDGVDLVRIASERLVEPVERSFSEGIGCPPYQTLSIGVPPLPMRQDRRNKVHELVLKRFRRLNEQRFEYPGAQTLVIVGQRLLRRCLLEPCVSGHSQGWTLP